MGAHSEGIRIGVVGVGYWGSKHLRVPLSTTGVATVVGVEQRFAGNDDIPQQLDFDVAGYTDIEHALPNVDPVPIATPPSTHAQLSLQAIEAGKHVLVEKPLATTSVEAQLVVDMAVSPAAADGHSGLDVVQVLECGQISLREQRPVELAEVIQQAIVPAQRLRLQD